MTTRATEAERPRFSFVTAVYESAPYLPAYLASVAALEGGHDDLEIVFVDDGSPDESVRIIEEWLARTRTPGRVVRIAHGGSVAARNAGLDAARGVWVSFPDPDDALDAGYLAAVRRFLAEEGSGEPALLAAKVLRFQDDPADAIDDHVLGFRYHRPPGCVRLADDPRCFHAHAPSGFYRRDVIERAGLRLDPRLGAAFEDAGFVGRYLLEFDDPSIGVVPDAVYRYRRRVDSVLGTMWSKPERYTAVPEHGYLRLLDLRTDPPRWLQLLVLYDLIWYFWEYDLPGTPNRSLEPSVAARFLELLDPVLARLDPALLYAYPLHPLPLRIRAALTARATGVLPITEAHLALDGDTTVISYLRPPGPSPVESLIVDGAVRRPDAIAEEPVEYYGDVFLVQRTLRVRGVGTTLLLVDGVAAVLSTAPNGRAVRFAWDEPSAEAAPESPPPAEAATAPATARPRFRVRRRRGADDPTRPPPT